ncbi:MAG: glycosyl hydrolase family 28 protein [Clostridia bacterium]|nr:glycosyl hydrolase family 28 protein [Clostridia bacterium]
MSIRLYPVQPNDMPRVGYHVLVNGMDVPTDAARVSAVPYTRRWPGHQRTLDQTEGPACLPMYADEPLTFEVTLPRPSDHVVIRPKSLGIVPELLSPTKVRFTMPEPVYCTVEPYERHEALHLFIDREDYSLSDTGDPSVLYYGPGVHEVGQIELKDGQTLFLDEGAVVYACIRAKDASHIAIRGAGILDNSHNLEEYLFEYHTENNDTAVKNVKRQHTIQLEYCTDITIDGITIRDSLVYNIRPMACRDLTIRNVKIIGCWRFNSDGIDMHNCENVLIEHCFLRTFDDSICVKGFDCYYEGDVEAAVKAAMYRNGQAYDVFRHVLIRDCTIWNDWGKCLEIGAETRAEEISDIVFEDCSIIHVTSSILDCCNVDYADVHDVTYRNIHVELDEVIPVPKIQALDGVPYENDRPGYTPALICGEVIFHHEYSAGGTRRGVNRDLLFENIDIIGGGKPIVVFSGFNQDAGCHDITVRNVSVDGKRLSSEADFQWFIGNFCDNIRLENHSEE